MKKSLRGYISLLLVCLILGTSLSRIRADEIEQAENKKAELSNAASQTKATIEGLNQKKAELEKLISQLDKEMESVSKDLNVLIEKLNTKTQEIEKTQADLEVAKEKERVQFQNMKRRIQFMYENGSQDSMLHLLVSAKSLGELLNQAEYFNELSSYDRAMLNEYIAAKELVIETGKKLAKEKKELEEAKTATEAKQKELSEQTAEKTKQVAAFVDSIVQQEGALAIIQNEMSKTNNLLVELIAAKKAQEEAVRKAQEEAARQAAEQAAARTTSSASTTTTTSRPTGVSKPGKVSNSGYVWPTSGPITSGYGYRGYAATGGVGTAFHDGIDIGAPTGTPVVAAAAGVVVASTGTPMSDGRGNYIQIKHDNGATTIYMHLSSLGVSAGTRVEQGQYIGAVGSTGWSTGPHLHFGLNLGNGYIDPMPYLP